MNILYLSADRGIPVRGVKGAAVHVRSMCRAFSRMGHSVTVMTSRPGPKDGQPVEAHLLHVPLPGAPDGLDEPAAAREAQALAYRDDFLQAALQELRARRYDFIYERFSLWSDAGARASHATGLPLVVEVNAPLREEAARYRTLFNHDAAAEIEAAQLRGAAAIVAVSEPLAEYLVEQGAPPERVHVLPNGVDPERFHPGVRGGKVRTRYNLAGKNVIGFVGRVRPWHDLGSLLLAFARLYRDDRRCHLLLVGRMPDDLPAQLDELGIRQAVALTGPISHAEVPAHIAAMDVAVSSHADVENFYFSPLKLFEYMACGVPTVAAGLGQLAGLLRSGETAEMYRPGDVRSLAAEIARLLQNPVDARRIAWQGAAFVLRRHTWSRNAASVVSWIRPAPPLNETLPGGVALPILDDKLRQRLYRATRPDLAAGFLRPFAQSRRRLAGMEIEVLKYKPRRRCVLRYSWKSRTGERKSLIGKIFRDERGRRLDSVQRILWQNGFGEGDVQVTEPLGYIPKMRMQLQAEAAGRTLNDLHRGGEHIDRYLSRCASGIAQLHALPESLPESALKALQDGVRTYGLAEERESLHSTRKTLAELAPATSRETDELHRQLDEWGGRLTAADRPLLVHRDFYYSQVLVAPERVTIIDLDLLAMGDEAIDIANFSAHLFFLGLETDRDFDALAGEAERFKAAYARSRAVSSAFWRRVEFYEAATFFRLLRVVAARPQKSHIFQPLLARVTGVLERV